MEYETLVINGIKAIKRIMGQCPAPILMSSPLSYGGARIMLGSLEAETVILCRRA
jgi:two-component system chemotaxis response regulator CheB|tara:strand:+ start:178 stop:342 length:165 start_codon:yes stop_codon:yes gene_type:complete